LISVNTNPSALQGFQAFSAASKQLAQTEDVVSTGLAVANPSDKPADWAIAQTMRSQASAWQSVGTGLQRAQTITDVAAASAQNIGDILETMKADVLSLSDTSLDPTSAAALTTQIQNLVSQVDQTANSANYSGVNLLVPITQPAISLSFPMGGPSPSLSFSSAVNGEPGIVNMAYSFTNVASSAPNEPTLTTTGLNPNSSIEYPGSSHAGQTINWNTTFDYGDLSNFAAANPSSISFDFNTSQFPTPPPPASPPPASYGVTVQSLTLTPYQTNATVPSSPNGGSYNMYYYPMTSSLLGLSDIGSLSPDQMMSAVDGAIAQVTSITAQIGTAQNALTGLIGRASTMQAAITTGVGNLVDADLATASASLQAQQTKQQLAATALSVANAEPQMLLSLFRKG
jgi:flagellin